jgi:hypothetical protein
MVLHHDFSSRVKRTRTPPKLPEGQVRDKRRQIRTVNLERKIIGIHADAVSQRVVN